MWDYIWDLGELHAFCVNDTNVMNSQSQPLTRHFFIAAPA